MSWRPEVMVTGEKGWSKNALRFATRSEAITSATLLAGRWSLVTDYRAVECEDKVNAVLDLTTHQTTLLPDEVKDGAA